MRLRIPWGASKDTEAPSSWVQGSVCVWPVGIYLQRVAGVGLICGLQAVLCRALWLPPQSSQASVERVGLNRQDTLP